MEYNNEKKHCRDIYVQCVNKEPACTALTEFCSDECRSIYHKVLRCGNSTVSDQTDLQNLYLLCAISGDPKYTDSNRTCFDLIMTSRKSTHAEYASGLTACQFPVVTNLTVACSDVCRNLLIEYRNDCCSINQALTTKLSPGGNNDNLISIYDHRLWKHCGVDSPRMCPMPPCLAEAAALPPAPLLGGAPAKHHVNWFILFTTLSLLLYM